MPGEQAAVRHQPCWTVSVGNTTAFPCAADQSILSAVQCAGSTAIPVGCRGGGCGICKIHVSQGVVRTRRMSKARLSDEERASGFVLACCAFPESDLQIEKKAGE